MNEILTGMTGGLGALIVVVAGLAFILYLVPIPLWISAWASGAYVGLFTLIAMRLRRVPPATVVTARISAVKAGLVYPATIWKPTSWPAAMSSGWSTP